MGNESKINYENGVKNKAKNNFTEAIKDFSNAIIYNNEYVEAYNQRALCYLAESKYDLSIIDCNKAIDLTSNNNLKALLFEVRSRSYIEKKDYVNAITDLNKSCEITFTAAFDKRGNLHYKLGNYYEALLDFNQMSVMFPSDGNYKFKMGICYYRIGDLENALENVENSMEMGYDKGTLILEEIKTEILLKKLGK